jgi:hypothetical protein
MAAHHTQPRPVHNWPFPFCSGGSKHAPLGGGSGHSSPAEGSRGAKNGAGSGSGAASEPTRLVRSVQWVGRSPRGHQGALSLLLRGQGGCSGGEGRGAAQLGQAHGGRGLLSRATEQAMEQGFRAAACCTAARYNACARLSNPVTHTVAPSISYTALAERRPSALTRVHRNGVAAQRSRQLRISLQDGQRSAVKVRLRVVAEAGSRGEAGGGGALAVALPANGAEGRRGCCFQSETCNCSGPSFAARTARSTLGQVKLDRSPQPRCSAAAPLVVGIGRLQLGHRVVGGQLQQRVGGGVGGKAVGQQPGVWVWVVVVVVMGGGGRGGGGRGHIEPASKIQQDMQGSAPNAWLACKARAPGFHAGCTAAEASEQLQAGAEAPTCPARSEFRRRWGRCRRSRKRRTGRGVGREAARL